MSVGRRGRHGRVGRAVKDLGQARGDLDVRRYRHALCDRAPRWIEDGEAARVVGVGVFQESSRGGMQALFHGAADTRCQEHIDGCLLHGCLADLCDGYLNSRSNGRLTGDS